ncbi:hypothetical protein [Actinomadura atramentaria]|uniref:hypothetical protein n=1 Tax=Actinomadura atramentaria TaxID=1990 RepID=UPI00037A8006|nr:hypothetical protein [Actinomadura atramentaria]
MPNAHTGLAIVAESDLLGFALSRPHRRLVARLGLVTVPIPLAMPPLRLDAAWHVRFDSDAAHAWMRRIVRDAVPDAAGPSAPDDTIPTGPDREA